MSREGMIPRNFFLHSKIFILITIFTSSCGLYTSPYLSAPNVTTFEPGIPSSALIYNRSDNDPEVFRGYEIYYKYYNSHSEIADDDKKIFNTSEPEPDDLKNVGYRRLNTVLTTEETTTYPMIPVDYSDRDTSFTLTVYFDEVSSDTAPRVEYSGYSDRTLRRNITQYNSTSGKTEYKTFIPADHDSGDSDRSSGELTLSLYVFAYGKDDNVYNIYSKPVWLGYITY